MQGSAEVVEAPGERTSWQEGKVPGCEEECQHLLADAIHVHHEGQLVLSHGVGAQRDLAEENSRRSVTPQSHRPGVRKAGVSGWEGTSLKDALPAQAV